MGGITLPDIKFLLYSYNNQESVTLAEKWIHRSKELNGRFRNRPTQICLADF